MKALMLSNSPNFQYQVNRNVVTFIEPCERPKPVVLETKASFDQNGQNDHPIQTDEILNDDQFEHSNHKNYEQIIDNLTNTKDVQNTKPSYSQVEDTSVPNTGTVSFVSPSSIPSMASPVPQDRWFKEKPIELVNIVGNPGVGMLTRAMAKQLSAALAHECLFTDFLSEEALMHPGWVDVMQ
ncbi:hypothetical protein Tco_0454098 [Tanacetum coccineum]